MKFEKIVLLVALLATPLFVKCQTQKKDNIEVWQNSSGSISISHPKDWIKWELNSGEVVAFVTPKDGPDDRFPDMLVLRESVNYMNQSLQDLEESAKRDIKQQPNMELVSSEQVKVGNYTALKTIMDQVTGDELRLINYTYTIGDKIYLLSLSIEKRNFDRFKSIGEASAKSLKVEQ
ncbi:PsbP-related protein [uncultured Pontibacter sp.]|uniref:PsbP-related protein n=1 Tax=uncultured Pontibacter sp. TaxID=453356 RepID=UPI00261C7D76|nr:PsbP-related protein [uncultured Pontibacter sp.]